MSTAIALSPVAAPRAARPPTNKWLVTLSVTFGTLMGAIDSSIVNVAIGHIRGSVGATLQEITWISTGFAIAQVLVMPLTGFLGRLFGQKRVYMTCLGIFLVGSVLCGLARTLPMLVAFRAIQGFGAGALQPTEQAILRQTFPPKEQGMAMALFSVAIMVGPAVGPTLGGYIVDNYAWPWIFYINVPVGLLGLYMVYNFVHEPEDVFEQNRALAAEQRKHMDWAGIALLSMGLVSMQYVLEEGQTEDWFQSKLITALAATAVFSLAAFVIRELTARVPAVNLRLFKDPVFLTGSAIGAMMMAMLMGNMFLLPVFMQELLGFTAMQSGMALIPRVIVMMVCMPIVGRLYNKLGARTLIVAGILMYVAGAFMMHGFTLQTTSSGVVSSIVIQGVGFSCMMVPLTTTALANVPRHLMSDATGLNSLLRQSGGSIGLAVFTTLLSRYSVQAAAGVRAHLTEVRPEVADRLRMLTAGFVSRGMDPVSAHNTAVRALAGSVAQQSMTMSFEQLFLLTGICFLAVLPLLYFLKERRAAGPHAPGEHVHVEIE